jgi:hypothetical protein
MGTKSTSRLLKMVPREIRAIIMDRPILTSESQEDYDDLLLCFAEFYKPKDVRQWLNVKRACVLTWEEQRMHRIMPAILETAPVMEDARCKEEMLIGQFKSLAAQYPDKYNKKDIQQEIKEAKVPTRCVEAKAIVERMSVLEVVEKLLLSKGARLRLVHEELAECQTVEVLPQTANDNKEAPKLTSHHQGEDNDDLSEEADGERGEEPDEEKCADEMEANEEQAVTEAELLDAEVEPDPEDVLEDEESDDSEEAA